MCEKSCRQKTIDWNDLIDSINKMFKKYQIIVELNGNPKDIWSKGKHRVNVLNFNSEVFGQNFWVL